MDPQKRKNIIIAIVVIFVFAQIIHGIQYGMVKAAQKEVQRTDVILSDITTMLADLQQKNVLARKTHLPRYLEKFTISNLKISVSDIKKLNEQASKAGHPNKKRDLAYHARVRALGLKGSITEKLDYLAFLDKALAS